MGAVGGAPADALHEPPCAQSVGRLERWSFGTAPLWRQTANPARCPSCSMIFRPRCGQCVPPPSLPASTLPLCYVFKTVKHRDKSNAILPSSCHHLSTTYQAQHQAPSTKWGRAMKPLVAGCTPPRPPWRTCVKYVHAYPYGRQHYASSSMPP